MDKSVLDRIAQTLQQIKIQILNISVPTFTYMPQDVHMYGYS